MNEEITPSSFRQDTKMHNAPFVFLFLQHLKKYPASTLICTDSDNSADLLHRAGQELGVEIPGKIALTGFGDVTHLPIATVNQNPERQGELAVNADASYFHYCANNTIFGTAWDYVPDTGAVPLVCDMSSEIMSHPVDVARYELIYAGAQKNMAPAGLTVVIVDKAAVGRERADTPQIMSYKLMVEKDSMLNTPPCWCIYMLGLVLDWVEAEGGVAAMDARRRERSGLIYEVLDNSRLYKPHAAADSRSCMNVTFRTGSEEMDAEFCKGAAARGLLNVKGHRLTGGMRASLYNAMPIEGAKALAEYMKDFEVEHHV